MSAEPEVRRQRLLVAQASFFIALLATLFAVSFAFGGDQRLIAIGITIASFAGLYAIAYAVSATDW